MKMWKKSKAGTDDPVDRLAINHSNKKVKSRTSISNLKRTNKIIYKTIKRTVGSNNKIIKKRAIPSEKTPKRKAIKLLGKEGAEIINKRMRHSKRKIN